MSAFEEGFEYGMHSPAYFEVALLAMRVQLPSQPGGLDVVSQRRKPLEKINYRMRFRPGGADELRRPLRGGISIAIRFQRLPPLANDDGPSGP